MTSVTPIARIASATALALRCQNLNLPKLRDDPSGLCRFLVICSSSNRVQNPYLTEDKFKGEGNKRAVAVLLPAPAYPSETGGHRGEPEEAVPPLLGA